MAKVLIVEDDRVIAEGMARHLASAGFDPVVVGRGEQGLARLRFERPDVVVLDLMLPERDGWSVIEEARSEGIATPIVVVSARGTEHDRVHALEIGADDYLVKPSSMNELVARARAASRRALRRDDAPRREPVDIEELRIDPRALQARVDLVDDVDRVVLAIGAADPEQHREPADRTEPSLLGKDAAEHELVPDPVEVPA